MKTWKLVVAVLAVLCSLSVAAPAMAATDTDIDVKVMTQNLYIGADLDRILQGEDPAAVFQTVLDSNFLARAAVFAEKVDEENPDLIGLQEVTRIEILDSPQGNLVQPPIDYLEIVMGNLLARGLTYDFSSQVINADVTLPVFLNGQLLFVRVIDRDVIIHHTGTTTVSEPMGENFAVNFTFELGGFPVEFTRGYTAVDAVVGGSKFHFVNTHLEVQNAPCLTPSGLVICQEVQAAELVDSLYFEPLPTILVGDFNSEPDETTYHTFKDRGYADTWQGGDGFTCCESETLDNPDSELFQRIDHVFYRKRGTKLDSAITETIIGKTEGGLWFSDHAGVVAGLELQASTLPNGEIDPNDVGDD